MQKKYINLLSKILGLALFVWLTLNIYSQLTEQPQLSAVFKSILHFSNRKFLLLALVIILMFINYGIEAFKWKLVLSPFLTLSLYQSLKNIFTGQAFAFTTINNLGDYVGKVWHLKEDKVKLGALSVYTSFSQVLVILYFGFIGYLCSKQFISSVVSISFFLHQFVIIVGVIIVVVFTFLYYNLFIGLHLIKKIPLINKFFRVFDKLIQIEKLLLTKLLLYSICRYVVFVVQYLLVLLLFGISSLHIDFVSIVALFLLAITIIPSIAFAELGIRGQLSILFFGWLTTNTVAIVLSAVFIWLINKVIPAIIGTIFTVSIKLKK